MPHSLCDYVFMNYVLVLSLEVSFEAWGGGGGGGENRIIFLLRETYKLSKGKCEGGGGGEK